VRAANELALEAFKRLEALPDSRERREVRATLARAQRRYVDAIAELKAALALAPGDPELLDDLGTSYYSARDFEQAVTTLEPVLRQDPEDVRLLTVYGDSLLQLQRIDEALKFLGRAVQLDPSNSMARLTLGRAYVQKGDFASAIPLIAVTSPRIGAGVGVLVAIFYRLDDVVPGSLADKVAPRLAPGSLVAALLEIAAVLAFALGASLVGTTLAWAGFRIVRDGPRLRLRRGLLSYRETVVPVDRVRAVQMREGLAREALGLCSLTVRTAGRAKEAAQSGVLFPLLARSESAGLVRETIPELELEGIPLLGPPRRARGRAVRRLTIPAAIVAVPPAALLAPYGLLALLLVPAAALLSLARFRAEGVGLEGDRLAWRRRVLARSTLVAQARSVQWRRVRQSPLQRRRALATLEVGLAVGGVEVSARDLDAGDAAALARAL